MAVHNRGANALRVCAPGTDQIEGYDRLPGRLTLP
jgi:hypothetical protein